jgi:hypothetical protein
MVDGTIPPAGRVCTKCGEYKPNPAFSTGRNQCKACGVIAAMAWAKANPARVLANSAALRARRRALRRPKQLPLPLLEGRVCMGCGAWKPAREFWLDRRRRERSQSRCKACRIAEAKTARATNGQNIRRSERRSKQKWRAIAPDDVRLRRRLRVAELKFGISPADYLALFASQGERCAICRTPILIWTKGRGSRGVACVDHDHETNEVRGLLCHACNTAIGLLNDSVEQVRMALQYLTRWKANADPG